MHAGKLTEEESQTLLTVREWAFQKALGVEIPKGSQPSSDVFHRAGQIQALTQMIFWIDSMIEPIPGTPRIHVNRCKEDCACTEE